MAYESRPQSGITREQKTGVVLLLVFGVLAVGLGVLQMRNTIYDPFVVRFNPTNRDVAALFENEEARLQQIDTDQDGLSDYDELTFYETSPYLPDTDSDGAGDKDEIDAGTDPNCPPGETCTTAETITPRTTSTVQSPLFNAATSSTLELFAANPALAPATTAPAAGQTMTRADIEALIKNPAALRKVLLASGQITKEQLDAISDQALVEMAEELFQKELSEVAPANAGQ